MKCAGIRQFVLDYLAGRLSGVREKELQVHCADCPACGEMIEGIRENERILRRAKAPPAPDRIWARIESEIGAARFEPVRRTDGNWMRKLAAAAAVLLVVLGVVLLPAPSPPPFDFEIVEVHGNASQAFLGLIPGFEEPDAGARVAGALLSQGRRGE